MSFNTTAACTVQYFWGVQGRSAEDVMGETLTALIDQQLGHMRGGLAHVIYMGVKAETSGKHGHHDYQNRPHDMERFADLVREGGIGTVTLSDYNGAETATGSEIQVMVFGPIGPLPVLKERVLANPVLADLYMKHNKAAARW